MTSKCPCLAGCVFVLGFAMPGACDAQQRVVGDALVGLGHIPLVVQDMDAATDTWRKLGFSIKPGTLQDNGISNNEIKFVDGAGIELIAVPAAVDALTEQYRDLLDAAEGPASFAFHASNFRELRTRLRDAEYPFRSDTGTVARRSVDYIFFDQDKRSRSDGPYLIHPNHATAMVRVWIATDRDENLAKLLVTLGGEPEGRTVFAPDRVSATVVSINNGEVLIMPESRQLTRNRPVIGATFTVDDLDLVRSRLTAEGIPFAAGGTQRLSVIVAPDQTHGMWVEFRE